MIRAYIAGPYTAGSAEGVELNVSVALDAWHRLRDAGFVPFCPHLSHFLHQRQPRHYEDWMDWDLEWLGTCDVLVRLDGASPGADREVARAKELGIAVYTLDEAIRVFGKQQ